ncbi:MAG: hypothetical protein Q7S24_02390 [bacterium]|nr:hypothetical protein [bacterium]
MVGDTEREMPLEVRLVAAKKVVVKAKSKEAYDAIMRAFGAEGLPLTGLGHPAEFTYDIEDEELKKPHNAELAARALSRIQAEFPDTDVELS